MLIPAGIVASVAVWDLTRRLGDDHDDPELAEAGLVFGPAAGFLAVCLVVAIDPPVLRVASGLVLEPSLEATVRWAADQAVDVWMTSTILVAVVEAALLASGRIKPETTLVRYARRPAHGAAGEVAE